jgi:hypothetical protein
MSVIDPASRTGMPRSSQTAAPAEPAVVSVLAAEPELLLDRAALFQQSAQRAPHALLVFRVEGELRAAQGLVGRVPQQLAEAGEVMDLVAVQVPLPQALVRTAAQQLDPLDLLGRGGVPDPLHELRDVLQQRRRPRRELRQG